MERAQTGEQVQACLARLRNAEEMLCAHIRAGEYDLISRKIGRIQKIRYSAGWKAYLGMKAMLHAVLEKRAAKLLKSVMRRDTAQLRNSMLAEDRLRPVKEDLRSRLCTLTRDSEACQNLIREQQDALLALMDLYQSAGKKAFLFMAPYFTDDRLADGYFQRVQAVDHMLSEDHLRIYASWLDADDVLGVPHVYIWDDTHIEIRYPHPDPANDDRIVRIARKAGTVYHHCITFANELVTRDESVRKIFDMHGAYPEELRMYGREEQAGIDEEQERLAMQYGQAVVCVTQSMAEHLTQKYGRIPGEVILLPIFDEKKLRQCRALEKKESGKATVVYAGGMQKWQNVEMMQEAASRTCGAFRYCFFTPDPQAFWKKWTYGARSREIEVSSKTPDEVVSAYASCDYGFLLRDDIVVNRVACPTKLVEYLAAGILPILNTPNIGDFVRDGMAYISLEDFVSEKLPPREEKERLVEQNLKVVRTLEERYHQGRQQLCAWMESEAG